MTPEQLTINSKITEKKLAKCQECYNEKQSNTLTLLKSCRNCTLKSVQLLNHAGICHSGFNRTAVKASNNAVVVLKKGSSTRNQELVSDSQLLSTGNFLAKIPNERNMQLSMTNMTMKPVTFRKHFHFHNADIMHLTLSSFSQTSRKIPFQVLACLFLL